MNKQKKIGILTSGGDAPGMNAAIRAVVRTAIYNDFKVIGIRRGFDGLISADFIEMNARSVSDSINKGGTILLTARCPEMMTVEGQKKASEICKILGLDVLVVIGGDGSFNGALKLAELGVNVMCLPGTIDLDLNCSEYTIGFDTAVNTAMEAINKIRDTSSSHERCSVVEVMGRDAGYIAAWCAVTGGAEDVLIPEMKVTQEEVIQQILANRNKGKTHNLIVVAEGVGRTEELARHIELVTGIETRATILGHLQRGGSPTATDRMHASMMGYLAVEAFKDNKKNRIIVFNKGRYEDLDVVEALNMEKKIDQNIYDIIKILAI